MSGWGNGYVTDVTYTTGYYRQQSPTIMTLACLLGGVATAMPGPDDPVSYLELGCGQGFGALLMAASNPAWTVTAVDFNPAHIASARKWASQAAVDNVRFLESDLSTLADEPASAAIPEADFVSMHGVWSWVSAPVQSGIVRLLRSKVRPGGSVHVSYNALPAWGAAIGMQRLLREAGRRIASRSDHQAVEGLKVVQELAQANAEKPSSSPFLASLIERLPKMRSEYLAHEYMNESWMPCFHADVAQAFAGAKLEWVASANLAENFLDFALNNEQRAVIRRFDDPILRELMKDTCLNRTLRHDVFVRGARRIGPDMRDAALMEVSLALNIALEEMEYEVDMPAGRAELKREFYGPIVAAMVKRPQRVRDLLALPALEGKRDNPAELIGVLVGLGIAELALRPGAEPAASAMRFTRVIAADLLANENLGSSTAAASYSLSAGAPCTLFDLYVLERVLRGEGEESLESWVRQLGAKLNDEERGKLSKILSRCLRTRLPTMRAQGVF